MEKTVIALKGHPEFDTEYKKLLSPDGFFKIMVKKDWFFFFLDMNVVSDKATNASYDCSFRRNIVEVCEKCLLHISNQETNDKFKKFLQELSQISFLKSQDILSEDDRIILKTFYKNNTLSFLVCNQLWMKFGHQFFYLEIETLKFSIVFEVKKVTTLLKEIKKLSLVDAKVTVLVKSFF